MGIEICQDGKTKREKEKRNQKLASRLLNLRLYLDHAAKLNLISERFKVSNKTLHKIFENEKKLKLRKRK